MAFNQELERFERIEFFGLHCVAADVVSVFWQAVSKCFVVLVQPWQSPGWSFLFVGVLGFVFVAFGHGEQGSRGW